MSNRNSRAKVLDRFSHMYRLCRSEDLTQTRTKDFVAHSGLPNDLGSFDFLHYLGWLPVRTCISFMSSETLLPPTKIKVKKIIKTNETQFSNWERNRLQGKADRGKN